MIVLAPLRGVTTRLFRAVFAEEIAEAGFTEAVTPFISAMPGIDPLADDELRGFGSGPFFGPGGGIKLTPQFIGKDPSCLRLCLAKIKDAGYDTADLNCGCPFPMVRKKGRGSGILKTPDVLRKMLEAGCEAMGPGKFSAKVRIGLEDPGELYGLMPVFNEFPLRFLAVHARTARQMYVGECDWKAVEAVESVAKMPILRNGDIPLPGPGERRDAMIGRPFIRGLGARRDSAALLMRYVEALKGEFFGDRPVLGRVKELVSYWRSSPEWDRAWKVVKMCSSIAELSSLSVFSRQL